MNRSTVLCFIICGICVIRGQALAGSRSSTNYSITTDTIDSAGVNGQSANYTLYGSAIGEFAADTVAVITSTAYLDKVGYVGQLSDLLVMTSAVSRKTHGAAGTFDIGLPLSGLAGIECRSGGGGGVHQVIMRFATPMTFSSASVVGGGTIPSGGATVSGNQITVNLSGVPNTARLFVTFSGVTNGFDMSDVTVPMGVLVGDTTGDGSVNSADISQTKSKSGQAVGVTNFRNDVTVDSSLNSADISLVKSKSGTALP